MKAQLPALGMVFLSARLKPGSGPINFWAV